MNALEQRKSLDDCLTEEDLAEMCFLAAFGDKDKGKGKDKDKGKGKGKREPLDHHDHDKGKSKGKNKGEAKGVNGEGPLLIGPL